MNPFKFVRTQFYPDHDGFGLTAAACLLLRVLEAGYTGGMEAGENPYQYVLSALSQYGDNDFYRHLAAKWHAKANPHI